MHTHTQHFREDEVLAEKAETLIQHATDSTFLQTSERDIVLETNRWLFPSLQCMNMLLLSSLSLSLSLQTLSDAAGRGRRRWKGTGDPQMSPDPGMKRHTLTLHHLNVWFHLLPPLMQPPLPFEQLLLWQPRETAEQLCLIDSALFSRVASE